MPKPETATGSHPIWIDNRNTDALYRIYTAHKRIAPPRSLANSLKRSKFLALARFIAATPFTHHALSSGVGCEGCALVRQSKAIDLRPPAKIIP
jgi:hypothetical protein